jgi:hypothetical protein
MNTGADQDRRSTAAKIRHFFFGETPSDTWLSTAVNCFMTATLLALIWFPLRRTFANVEINYNEGWNAYRAAMVASGIPLYGTPPHGFGTGTAYPPLSFHLIGWLGTPSTFTAIGRWVSLISLMATGIFVSLIVRRAGGSRQTAVFSFLLYVIGIALLRPDRIGMNDPQLLGEALSVAGLYFYFRNPDSNRHLFVSALLFCLAGFTKPNLLAFPVAVAIDLLLRSRRAFVTWAGAMVVSAGLLMATTLLIDGHYFLVHLMGGGGRAYSYWMGWSGYHKYVEKFQTMLVIGAAWSICAFRSRRVVVSAFVLSHILAFLLAGGSGVDLNIFFNAMTALMFGLLFISIMTFVPGQLRRDREMIRVLPAHESEFNSAVDFVKTRPGPALCESLLLCYEAGKPFEYEPYSVRDLLRTGRLHEDEVLQLLRINHFQTIQVALRSDEANLKEWVDLRASLASDQKESDKERRFTPAFMRELLDDYQLSKRTSDMAIFCPK